MKRTTRHPRSLVIVKTIGGHVVVDYKDHNVTAKRFYDGPAEKTHSKAVVWLWEKLDLEKRVNCFIRGT